MFGKMILEPGHDYIDYEHSTVRHKVELLISCDQIYRYTVNLSKIVNNKNSTLPNFINYRVPRKI